MVGLADVQEAEAAGVVRVAMEGRPAEELVGPVAVKEVLQGAAVLERAYLVVAEPEVVATAAVVAEAVVRVAPKVDTVEAVGCMQGLMEEGREEEGEEVVEMEAAALAVGAMGAVAKVAAAKVEVAKVEKMEKVEKVA